MLQRLLHLQPGDSREMRIGCDDCCADGESTASNHKIGQG
jgi:hypothetical protein